MAHPAIGQRAGNSFGRVWSATFNLAAMKRNVLVTTLIAALPSFLAAQHFCASDEATRLTLQSMGVTEPAAPQAFDVDAARGGGGSITIPALVHIVWNLAEAKVHQMTTQLSTNDNLGNNISGVRAQFQGLAEDMEMNFCLAQVDPNGAPTNGIVRHETTVTFFDVNQMALVSAMKQAPTGSPAWDPSRYLNIWFCDLASPTFPAGVGGFVLDPAQPGIVGSNVDGVVLDHWPGLQPYGPFSATHEVGHYLGLMHTWGPNQNCTSSDLVMYENFMDHASCASIFTPGQKTRAHNFLNSQRPGLLNNEVCSMSSGMADMVGTDPIRVYQNELGTQLEWTGKATALRVFDANGRQLFHVTVTGTSHLINTTSFAPGAYTAVLQVNDVAKRARFVVTH